jgi:hypothetical protein
MPYAFDEIRLSEEPGGTVVTLVFQDKLKTEDFESELMVKICKKEQNISTLFIIIYSLISIYYSLITVFNKNKQNVSKGGIF